MLGCNTALFFLELPLCVHSVGLDLSLLLNKIPVGAPDLLLTLGKQVLCLLSLEILKTPVINEWKTPVMNTSYTYHKSRVRVKTELHPQIMSLLWAEGCLLPLFSHLLLVPTPQVGLVKKGTRSKSRRRRRQEQTCCQSGPALLFQGQMCSLALLLRLFHEQPESSHLMVINTVS